MNQTILLIEDNAQNRYLVTFLLEQHGFTVISANTGPSGIALAQEKVPDLILLDIQLPGMDGYAVARALRAIDILAPIPIMAVTADSRLSPIPRSPAISCQNPTPPAPFTASCMAA